jgi:hypothetical protein
VAPGNIERVNADDANAEHHFDLLGRSVDAKAKGLQICNGRLILNR